MKSFLSIKNLLAIGLIAFGIVLAWQNQSNTIIDEEEIAILEIEEPTPEILELVQSISDLVTDPTDRAKLAIFNQEFATRITNYETDNQKTNDVYVLAASYFFKSELNDKYDGLDQEIIKLIRSSIGDDNHVLTTEEKVDLSKKFTGLAWSLIQKR